MELYKDIHTPMNNAEFLCQDDLDYRDIQAINGLKGDDSLNYDCCGVTKVRLTMTIQKASYTGAVKRRLNNSCNFIHLELSCM